MRGVEGLVESVGAAQDVSIKPHGSLQLAPLILQNSQRGNHGLRALDVQLHTERRWLKKERRRSRRRWGGGGGGGEPLHTERRWREGEREREITRTWDPSS